MSLSHLYESSNKNNVLSNVYCNSLNVKVGGHILDNLYVAGGAVAVPTGINYTIVNSFAVPSGTLVSNFNASTGVFTAPEAGIYILNFSAIFPAHATANTHRSLRIVGAVNYGASYASNIANEAMQLNVCCQQWLEKDQAVNFQALQDSGVSLNLSAGTVTVTYLGLIVN